ncbi:MAG: peptide deformylase [Endomicrobia bacterium]|nr:peptide deformylase [Endomicrobiia bacterium]
MSVLKILKYPSKLLKEKSLPVEKFNSDLKHIVKDMFETMYAFNGIGLAANQVGINKRIIVVDLRATEQNHRTSFVPIALVNPEILNYSKKKIVAEEGCLSFPGYYDKVSRAESIEVVFYDITGKKNIIVADGLLARVIQHEIDHINGIRFVQRMSIPRQIKFHLLYLTGKYKF